MSTVNPSTNNVRLGVCKVFFGNEDLGFTKGGVEVEVTTNTTKITVDQFGDTEVDERIRGRMIKVKVPLAETTLKNMTRTFPGSTFVETGGAAATGTITITTNPANGETIVVNGVTFTFKTVASIYGEVAIGGTSAVTATNLANAINAHPDTRVTLANATVASNVVTLTYEGKSTEGNSYTLATGTAGAKVTMSGATLTGGSNPTAARVDVSTSVGVSLMATAKELRLHPIERDATDLSEDVVIPKANTPGSMQFAYKLEDERIYNVEFNGYPDPTQNYKLFSVGDPLAI